MSDTPTPIGSDVQVNTDNSYSQLTPVVAALSDGGYVVIWYKAAGAFGSLGLGVFGQRYSAEGAPVGDEFHVNVGTTDTGVTPAVGALKDGGFVVTWSSWGPDGSGLGVYGQRFDQ